MSCTPKPRSPSHLRVLAGGIALNDRLRSTGRVLIGLFDRKSRKPSVIMRADRAREAGQWQLAARLYREALDRKPDNPPIWVQYGHALKECGNRADAELAYRTALGYWPDDADAHLQLGHVLKVQGKIAEAQAAYRRALALDRPLVDAARELGQQNQADWRRDRESLAVTDRAAMDRKSKRVKASLISRGDRAREAQRWNIAVRFYRKALDRNPNNAPIWVQYGHALKESGDLAGGESAYRAAILRDPSAADPYLHLGHILKLRGKPQESQAAYLQAVARDPRSPAAFEELRRLGWSDERIAELRRLTTQETRRGGNR